MTTPHPRRVGVALACGATLLLASCGGGGGDDSPDDLAQLLEDAGNGDLSDLDPSELEDLLGELDSGDLGDLGDADLGDVFGEDGPLAGLEELIEEESGGDIQFGEDGFSFESEDGGVSIDEDGNFTVTDGEGNETSGQFDVGGDEFSVESDDGSFDVSSSDELPEDWPDDVPTPDGLGIESVVSMDADEMLSFTVSGVVDGDPAAWVVDYGEQLQEAGFEENVFTESGDDVSGIYQRQDYDMFVTTQQIGTGTNVTVTLTSSS